MATNKAIAATSAAIRQLFRGAATSSSAADWTNSQFELFQANDLQNPPAALNPTLSIYLYRIALSTVRRDRGPRIAADGSTYLSSIPIDLHYLVSAWSQQTDTAQLLLGWAVSVLNDTPVLPVALLNTYQTARDVFGPDESVELVWDPLSLTDLYDVWQVATQRQVPSASYVARSVVIDSEVEMDTGRLVQQRDFFYAQGPV